MHFVTEEHILLFLIQIFILLTTAKVLGEYCCRRGYPAVAGEILTGIILGPTILGRLSPALYELVFPSELVQRNMLETVSWIGVLFLLLATGFEVKISTIWKQGRASLTIGFVGVFIPFLLGVVVFWWFPPVYWGAKSNHLVFTLFLATAAAISAIPVIAKILHELDILKTDFGLITLSAFVVNDMLGWLVFALIISMVGQGHVSVGKVVFTFLGIGVFSTICLIAGSKSITKLCRKIKRLSTSHSVPLYTLIYCIAVLTGIITQSLGIHAILGFFLAGIMVGNSKEITQHTKEDLSQMIHGIFVPIFFASIGLKIDFLSNLDIFAVSTFTAVAIGGKFIGAWIGGLMANLSMQDSVSLGIAHIPGGAMEIILGVLALELGLVPENIFVAIVFAALSSSVMVGPMLAWSVRQRQPIDVSEFLLQDALVMDLRGQTRWEVIDELSEMVSHHLCTEHTKVFSAIKEKEDMVTTSIENGVAIPHAYFKGLRQSIIAFGISRYGIDWDATDGRPTHFVFMVLTPDKKDNEQIQILADITNFMFSDGVQQKALMSKDSESLYYFLKKGLKSQRAIWNITSWKAVVSNPKELL
jgi:Kef-type K+ transport system membrane component KefB